MVCCAIIAALLGLLLRPVLALRTSPLAWRPNIAISQGSQPMRAVSRLQSFTHAFAGLGFLARNEPNMRIHVGAGLAAILAGAWLHIDALEWRWLFLAIALVLVAEALNTAAEQACNAISRRYNPAIKAAKDVAAGAVLVAAMAAALIGLSVFGPYLVSRDFGQAQSFQYSICGGGNNGSRQTLRTDQSLDYEPQPDKTPVPRR